MIAQTSLLIFSGPEDNIFVYFTDHGAPGLVAFPEGEVGIVNMFFSVVVL